MLSRSALATAFWCLATTAFVLFASIITWLAVPSAYLLRVESIGPNGDGTMTIHRRVLVGSEVLANWHLTVMAEGRECSASGEAVYEATWPDGSPKTQATFVAPAQIRPCLDLPAPAVVGRFQVIVGPGIPLRPTYAFNTPVGGESVQPEDVK